VTTQLKATEQYFHVVLFIILYKRDLKSVDEIQVSDRSVFSIIIWPHMVMLRQLHNMVLLLDCGWKLNLRFFKLTIQTKAVKTCRVKLQARTENINTLREWRRNFVHTTCERESYATIKSLFTSTYCKIVLKWFSFANWSRLNYTKIRVTPFSIYPVPKVFHVNCQVNQPVVSAMNFSIKFRLRHALLGWNSTQ